MSEFQRRRPSPLDRPLQLPAGGADVAAARGSDRPRASIQSQPEPAYGTVTLTVVVTYTSVFMSLAVNV
jgi:hypothetical protein